MNNYDTLERFGRKGYVNLVKKINDFYETNRKFPENLNELNFKFALTNEDIDVLEHRGELERKLDKIQEPKLFLLQTYEKIDGKKYLSDNDQLIYTDFFGSILTKRDSGVRLVSFPDRSIYNPSENNLNSKHEDERNIGFAAIIDDVLNRRNNYCLRTLGTNARIAFVRPKNQKHQLIKPSCNRNNSNHVGTLVMPICQIENVLDNKEDILAYCKKEGLYENNLEKINSLFYREVSDILRKEENTKSGIIGTPRIIKEKLGFAY